MAEPLNLDISYEDLMAQKLAGVDPSLDTREGTSLIFNATAANSAETIQMLFTLKNMVDLVFADTAPREYLIRRAKEKGLEPANATKARLKGVFNIDVPINSRFSLDELNYEVIEKIALGEFILECETAGNIGNLFFGQLIPIDYIDGLTSAELTEVLIPGEDEEDTEEFRKRYFNSFDSTAFGGNRKDYKDKVKNLPGVGGVRVYRAWNGGGTTKLVIINSQFEKPSKTLVDEVQEAVDPLGAQGEGLGIAPIDHIVTVFGVNETVINIATNITLQDGWVWEDVEPNVLPIIDGYFKELAEQWAQAQTYEEDHAGLIVRISHIETRILGAPGVLDIANTMLNGAQSNIALDKESIPKRGVVSG
ncbi:baseplate J/gp47 family protein [Bacillus sp. S/N-304-OC-R1]|uniref:baseplate J/gp47 family protein n=1 Tax=Bacillus sp. S/N-304-OC-R1 TaxID=2758034 RepID=UPI001C8E8743|nr:baseplate J/gp47 family protein [Bacillus sp. S/N-304-OC-R1]MBY0122145.1 baseplate J/gp47 family protein [Bacillus sp. S/N-304-OC-R1]